MQFSLSSFPIPTFRQNRGKEIFGLPLLSLISLRKSVNHLVYVLSQLMLIFRDQDARLQGSAKRRACLLSYSQAEPGRELTQPSPRLLAEPCITNCQD